MPNWATYDRRFRPAPVEWLFRAVTTLFIGLCLILAVFGGGAAPLLLALMGPVDGEVHRSVVGMMFLSIPVLLGLGYLLGSLLPALLNWLDITRGRGPELWPEDV